MAASFAGGRGPRPAEALALTRARQPGTDPFLDHRALEFGKHAQHLNPHSPDNALSFGVTCASQI
jgi:hypothetical protein